MFGPDVCGTSARRTHAILSYDKENKDGKLENFLHKSDIKVEAAQGITHLYTMILNSDTTRARCRSTARRCRTATSWRSGT